ncbi:sulfite exporter TauE/SafE family protein [Arhodomonas aquaeolei]|uniref:sulfite exporter TauE/SafE family protein n=1 Tax=Arhodomonas aquaeolei TaxID=2369 RepID=UPI00037AB662|nr:sulfite exporter TauE/SafE family protein [Arhodomonas aquaeolei]
MMGDITLIGALLAGLVGSTHCLGMCGGIASALGMGVAPERRTPWRLFGYALAYNAGRVTSYAVAGAVAGGVGLWLASLISLGAWTSGLRVAMGLVMAAIGVQVAFNWRLLAPLERSGMRVWARIAPLARGLMPVRSPGKALLLGGLWGWLPCGLVYGMLVAAALAGGAGDGAAVMVAFGLGTMPAMVLTGTAAAVTGRLLARGRVRLALGMTILVMGVWTASVPIYSGLNALYCAPV